MRFGPARPSGESANDAALDELTLLTRRSRRPDAEDHERRRRGHRECAPLAVDAVAPARAAAVLICLFSVRLAEVVGAFETATEGARLLFLQRRACYERATDALSSAAVVGAQATATAAVAGAAETAVDAVKGASHSISFGSALSRRDAADGVDDLLAQTERATRSRRLAASLVAERSSCKERCFPCAATVSAPHTSPRVKL